MIKKYYELCESLDACVINGELVNTKENRKDFKKYLERWLKEIEEWEKLENNQNYLTFKIEKPTKVKIFIGYDSLSNLHKHQAHNEGWDKEDFTYPDSEVFFEFENSIYSLEKDCNPVTLHSFKYDYEFKAGFTSYLLKINSDDEASISKHTLTTQGN